MTFVLKTYNQMIATADDFFEAAIRCGFDDSFKAKKFPLVVPHFTNRAFACELYLKATLYLSKNEILREHNLNKLFFTLNKKDRKEIYHIWRIFARENMPDCDYVEAMFCDNLEANSNVFSRFRYVYEWAGSTISLKSSFKKEQMYLHNLSASRPIGSPPIHDGFLDQFAKSLKKYKGE